MFSGEYSVVSFCSLNCVNYQSAQALKFHNDLSWFISILLFEYEILAKCKRNYLRLGWEHLDFTFSLWCLILAKITSTFWSPSSSFITECSNFCSIFTGIVRWIEWNNEWDGFSPTVKASLLSYHFIYIFLSPWNLGYFSRLLGDPFKFSLLELMVFIQMCPFEHL